MNLDDINDEYYASLRDSDKTYFSKTFTNKFNNMSQKFAYKVLGIGKTEYIQKDKVTLGINFSGTRQLKALFFTDKRNIEKLILQQFDDQEKPLKNSNKQASFQGNEVEALYRFLKSIKEVDFPSENTFNVSDELLSRMLLDKQQAIKLVSDNLEIIQEALNNNVTSKDIISFGYRKNQLKLFENLLNEDFFKNHKNAKGIIGDEAVWQRFFENNTWILGYGLDYIFNSELDNRKLELITSGANFNSAGKRTDALLKSNGAINSICFCEIKKSTDSLLKEASTPYRGESWQISESLAGAIAQVQRTVQKAVKDFSTKIEIKDTNGNLTGETLFHYNPKAFIIIGNLSEFIQNGGINEEKYSSFEMFRKNLRNIEILTYDELYERAYYICHSKENNV